MAAGRSPFLSRLRAHRLGDEDHGPRNRTVLAARSGAAVSLGDRLRFLGLQRRIMLFVVAGLAAVFGVLALQGLSAIDQATQLVFRERLATAYTTAGSIERDLGRVANDASQTSDELGLIAAGRPASGAADELLAHFGRVEPYPYFRVSGVWLLDGRGRLLEAAGQPSASALTGTSGASRTSALVAALPADAGSPAIGLAVAPVPGATAFASVAVRLAAGAASPLAILHLVSENATTDYEPANWDRAAGSAVPVAPAALSSPAGTAATFPGLVIAPGDAPAAGYHLEIVDPAGTVVLGIGADERPGGLSPHFAAIRELIADRSAGAMIHLPGPHDSFEPHVMAVVPLGPTVFTVVLEQPTDVALALPNQLRTRLILTIVIGFLAALLVAWVTTRHVVKPTEQLTRAARRMAAGDLSSPIDVQAEDEVGLLAESLDVMRLQLGAAQAAARRTTAELEERVAERTARLNQLLGQTIDAQEEERRRLARELHDETAQSLAALAITLDRARNDLPDAPASALARIVEARATSARLLDETRRLMMGLRPAVLDDMGLVPAIRWWAETALGDHGIEVSIEAPEAPPRLPGYLEVALFRLVQEAISNVVKHAEAHAVEIRLAFDETELEVRVSDDGRGFDVPAALAGHGPGGEHVGLLGMLERVRLLGGRLAIDSSAGAGTSVAVTVPIRAEAA